MFLFYSCLYPQYLIRFEQINTYWMRYNFGLSADWALLHHYTLLSVCLSWQISQCTVTSVSLNCRAVDTAASLDCMFSLTSVTLQAFLEGMSRIKLSEGGGKQGWNKMKWGRESLPKSSTAHLEAAHRKGKGEGQWLQAREGMLKGWQMECSFWGLSEDWPLQIHTMYRSKSNWGTCALKEGERKEGEKSIL
jgi:hypothetical protein